MMPIDFNAIILGLFVILTFSFLLFLLGYIGFILFRYRDREKRSINSVYLQVSVTRSNEVKIDAMEQLFASLSSIKKGGWKQKLSVQPAISFEIIAKEGDIKFYIWAPREYKDLIEKQIHGAYPDAEIKEAEKWAFESPYPDPAILSQIVYAN